MTSKFIPDFILSKWAKFYFAHEKGKNQNQFIFFFLSGQQVIVYYSHMTWVFIM